MIKLSIIVPIYNVEQYLRKCIDSLLNQDLPKEEYEIILVDDGSPDKCGAICDEYAEKSSLLSGRAGVGLPLIKVIHRENGGLSAARNSGIEVAQGKYIQFVDSDDYLEPNILAGLIAQADRDNLDVLRYRIQYVNSDYHVFNPYKSDPFAGNDYSAEPTDGITFLNERMNTGCYAWQFILRRELIVNNGNLAADQTSNIRHETSDVNNVLFTPGIYFEDTDWTPRMLVKANRVASTDTVVYNYLMREGSITNAVNRSKQKKVLDDKMRLVVEMQRQESMLRAQGQNYSWFARMISATVVSIIGILSTQFYSERKEYLTQLKQMHVFPIAETSTKARLINFSPRMMVELLHFKNG